MSVAHKVSGWWWWWWFFGKKGMGHHGFLFAWPMVIVVEKQMRFFPGMAVRFLGLGDSAVTLSIGKV